MTDTPDLNLPGEYRMMPIIRREGGWLMIADNGDFSELWVDPINGSWMRRYETPKILFQYLQALTIHNEHREIDAPKLTIGMLTYPDLGESFYHRRWQYAWHGALQEIKDFRRLLLDLFSKPISLATEQVRLKDIHVLNDDVTCPNWCYALVGDEIARVYPDIDAYDAFIRSELALQWREFVEEWRSVLDWIQKDKVTVHVVTPNPDEEIDWN